MSRLEQYQGEFGKHFQQGEKWSSVVIPNILAALPDSRQFPIIVDFGCGTGDLIPYLISNQYRQIIGIDQSESMLSTARSRNFEKSVTLIQAPAQKLPELRPELIDNVDVVVSIMVVPAIKEDDEVHNFFMAGHNVLRSGGKFIICVPHPQFDGYMHTEGADYNRSGALYETVQNPNGTELKYADYHRRIEDYVEFYTNAGFAVEFLRACGAADDIVDDRFSHLIMTGIKM